MNHFGIMCKINHYKMSIVVPSYNQSQFLTKTLDSIVGQSVFLSNIQVIIVDPGSNDGSLDIINKYVSSYQNIESIIGKDNGQVNAINIGLREAKGQIVGWLNSDDELCVEHAARVLSLFEKNADVDFVYAAGYLIDKNSDVIKRVIPPLLNFNLIKLIDRNFFIQPGTFWRRSLHEKLGFLDERFTCVFDNEWYLRVFGSAKTARIGFPGGSLRIYSETKSSRLQATFKQELWVMNKIYGAPLPVIDRVASKFLRTIARIGS